MQEAAVVKMRDQQPSHRSEQVVLSMYELPSSNDHAKPID